jgi:hypothetical protein
MRINVIFFALLLLTAPLAFANDQATPIMEGMVTVENDPAEGKTETILTLVHHPTTSMYVVRGLVRHRDVEQHSYLEMWSTMPDGRRYFSRQPVRLESVWSRKAGDWRQFELPFNLMNHRPSSVTLEINVVMPPGKGTIELSRLTISDIQPTEWFDGRTAGLFGGLLGTGIGCYAGLFSILYMLLVPRRKGRRLLISMLLVLPAIGTAMLLLGISALCLSQPYHVWYPFVLCGVLSVIVWIFPYREMVAKYKEFDQRKMQALDV